MTTILDKYSFRESDVIGTGQFGSVYKGVDIDTKEPVAIKVIPAQMLQNDYFKSMYQNEVKSLSKLSSPYIVRFIDIKSQSNNIYIITEYCEGGDLATYLAKKKRLPEDEVIDILWQTVQAFKTMKEYNLLHRDLKPANLLLHRGRIKIADLGFSKAVDNFQISIAKSYVGSPIYMSPQVLFKQIYTSKADVWSLGIMLYQLLYGDVPWAALDINELYKQVRYQPIAFKSSTPISVELKDLITRCLKYEEKDRISWEEIFVHPAVLKSRLSITEKSPEYHLNEKVGPKDGGYGGPTGGGYHQPAPMLTSMQPPNPSQVISPRVQQPDSWQGINRNKSTSTNLTSGGPSGLASQGLQSQNIQQGPSHPHPTSPLPKQITSVKSNNPPARNYQTSSRNYYNQGSMPLPSQQQQPQQAPPQQQQQHPGQTGGYSNNAGGVGYYKQHTAPPQVNSQQQPTQPSYQQQPQQQQQQQQYHHPRHTQTSQQQTTHYRSPPPTHYPSQQQQQQPQQPPQQQQQSGYYGAKPGQAPTGGYPQTYTSYPQPTYPGYGTGAPAPKPQQPQPQAPAPAPATNYYNQQTQPQQQNYRGYPQQQPQQMGYQGGNYTPSNNNYNYYYGGGGQAGGGGGAVGQNMYSNGWQNTYR